ncbi:MAG: hypothetical protein ACSHYF_10220 [Verrucomicrobiaceae bacterium]
MAKKATRRSRIRVAGAAFLTIGVLALIFSGPLKRFVWNWRFEAAVAEGASHLEKGDYLGAHNQLMLAWQLSDYSEGELLELLDLSRRLRSPSHIQIAERLLACPPSENESYLNMMEGALALGQLNLFRKIEEALPDELGETDEVGFMRSRLLYLEGKPAEAFLSTQQWFDEEVGDTEWHFVRQLLGELPDNEPARKLAALLIETDLENAEPEEALRAFRSIGALENAEELFDGRALGAWLDKEELGTSSDRLLAYSLEMKRSDAATRAALVQEVVARYQRVDSENLARWLLLNGERGELMALTTEELITYVARLQALMDAEQFAEALEELGNPHPRMERHLVEVTRACLEYRLGNKTQSMFHRSRAIEAAGLKGDYEALADCLRVAEHLRDGESARKLVEAITELIPAKLPAANELVFVEGYLDYDAEAICDFYERYSAGQPEDRFAKFRYGMMLAITGRDLSRARRLLIPLHRETPDPSLAAALSLTHLSSNPAKALSYLKNADPEKMVAQDRAILATVFFANGRVEEAKKVTQSMETAKIPRYLLEFLRKEWAGLPE